MAALKIPGVAIQTEYKREYPSQRGGWSGAWHHQCGRQRSRRYRACPKRMAFRQTGCSSGHHRSPWWRRGRARKRTCTAAGGAICNWRLTPACSILLSASSSVVSTPTAPKGGAAVVLDARSGEIFALVNYPDGQTGRSCGSGQWWSAEPSGSRSVRAWFDDEAFHGGYGD